MKIIAAKFTLEANEHVPMFCDLENTALSFGQEALSHMQLGEVTERPDLELIPVLCADAGCSGVMRKGCFDYLEQRILGAIREHLADLDGIYLHLHGASFVEQIGSGEQHLLQQIRKLTGPYLPIAIACDPHGNLTQEYVENTTFIRSYREAPHIDIAETVQRTFQTLIDQIEHPQGGWPVYRKLPLILGGEQSVSTDEPVRSINQFMDQLEQDPRILSCSYHIGYLRHDSAKCGAAVVVVPNQPEDAAYAQSKADEIYDFVWARHKEFHFTGYADEPEAAWAAMLKHEGRPCFLTDSGDNVTAGAPGGNTVVLRQVLAETDYHGKSILLAGITDKKLCEQVFVHQHVGDHVTFAVGPEIDELSAKVTVSGTILSTGDLHNHYHDPKVVGTCWTVKLDDRPVTLVIQSYPVSFAERAQYEQANVDLDGYDLIIVKQGYLYPELKAMASHYVMSLTDGACMQRTERLSYKKVIRPIYPLDNI